MVASDGVNGTVCNAQQYNQFIQSSANGSNPTISCLTHGETIGLAVSTFLVRFVLDSSFIQLTAEASFLSAVAVIIILARIAVRITSFHVSFLIDEILHSGTYDGIEGTSQMVTGGCSNALWTSTWSA
jgi:hypothetical protein